MNASEKNQLLDRLSVCYNRVNYLKVLCEEQNRPKDAEKLERRRERLKLEIDGLLRDIYLEWIGTASQIQTTIEASNTDLQKCIKDIEKKVKLAQNIVKAIGYVDDAIKIAADLVP